MSKDINIILLSGGGMRSLSFIGVFKNLEEILLKKTENPSDVSIPNINIKTMGAVSAGAIFALMYIIGYTSNEMEEIILKKNLRKLKKIRFINFIKNYGLDSGGKIISWIHSLMLKKKYNKDITLKEMYDKTGIDFQIFATNLNKYKLTKFNYIQTPDLKVTDAIRMSISIPFIFTINKFNLETLEMGSGDTYVDGGLINNYPINEFKDSLSNLLGLKIISQGEMENHELNEDINNMQSYVYHVLSCFMKKRNIERELSEETIYINIQGTRTINFDLSSKDIKELIKIGYNESIRYFDNCVSQI